MAPSATARPDHRRQLVVMAVVCVLMAGSLVGGVVLVLDQGASGRSSGPDSRSTAGSASLPSPSATSASSSPTRRPARVKRSCWDGLRATRSRPCTEPTGERGMRWVFPSYASSQDCAVRNAPYKLLGIRCLLPVPRSSRRGQVTYSEYRTHAELREHYVGKSREPGRPMEGGRLAYGPTRVRGAYEMSFTYGSPHVWAATSRAATARAARVLLAGVGASMRPAEDFAGAPPSLD